MSATNHVSLTRRRLLQTGALAGLSSLYRPVFAQRKHYDVIIVGAGLAGLQAARVLRRHGVDFLLLEGSSRVGGRVWTRYDLPGQPEVGGAQIATGYTALNEALAELGIASGAPNAPMPGKALLVNGQLGDSADWSASPGNQLTEALRDTAPDKLLRALLKKGRFLSAPADWWKPEYADLDVSLRQYLQALGAGPEALRLIAANLNGEGLDKVSVLDLLRKSAVLQTAGSLQEIRGGSQRLPEAMRAEIEPSLLLDKQVSAIYWGRTRMQLRTRDADRFTCQRCLLAVPFGVLRRIRLQSRLSPAKQAAIRQLGYTPVSLVFMRPKSPFWEADGLSPNLWTDTDLGRVFAQTDAEGKIIRLRSWLMGPTAQRLDTLSDAELGKHIIALLEQVRPAARSKLELEMVLSWGRSEHARGAFSHYPPGGVTGFSRAVASPEGLLHFIGAHTEPGAAGMEAAMMSGNRGAKEVMQGLSGSALPQAV